MARVTVESTASVDALVRRLKALAEPTRLRLVRLLAAGERCVCELTAETGASQPRLSYHLLVLKEAGLVRDRPDGRWVYYSIAPEALEGLGEALGDLARQWKAVESKSSARRC